MTREKQEKSLLEFIGVPASILAILTTAVVYGAGTLLRTGYLIVGYGALANRLFS